MMEPNKTDSLPFLSPMMPQIIPPISKPAICQLIIFVLADKTILASWKLTPRSRRLGLRTIVNKIVVEQEFFNYSRLNILLLLKKNPLKEYHRNSLKFLRKKKSKKSGYKVI